MQPPFTCKIIGGKRIFEREDISLWNLAEWFREWWIVSAILEFVQICQHNRVRQKVHMFSFISTARYYVKVELEMTKYLFHLQAGGCCSFIGSSADRSRYERGLTGCAWITRHKECHNTEMALGFDVDIIIVIIWTRLKHYGNGNKGGSHLRPLRKNKFTQMLSICCHMKSPSSFLCFSHFVIFFRYPNFWSLKICLLSLLDFPCSLIRNTLGCGRRTRSIMHISADTAAFSMKNSVMSVPRRLLICPRSFFDICVAIHSCFCDDR